MKLATINREITTNAVAPQKFKIAQNSKMFSILADKIYSDKPRAVVREICCNAMDAAPNVPFLISSPSYTNPFLSIRDYGPGMTEDQMFNLYTSFFDSTKQDDNSQIGGFGLGSKSPFAYTDTFTVSSYQNHVKKVYVAFRDSENMPNLTLASTEITDQRDGLEVIVPIKSGDVQRFKDTAKDVLKWFPEGSYQTFGFDAQPADWLFKTDTFGVLTNNSAWGSKRYALMGPVAYEMAWQSTGHNHLSPSVVPFFDIGELDLPPSRETLSYDDRTIENLKTREVQIRSELPKVTRAHYKTLTPAQRILFRNDLYQTNMLWELPKPMRKGMPELLDAPEGYVSVWERYGKQNCYRRVEQHDKFRFKASHLRGPAKAGIIYHDIQNERAPRIGARLKDHGTHAYYLLFHEKVDFDHLLRGVKFDLSNLSDLPAPEKVKYDRTTELQMYSYYNGQFTQSGYRPKPGDLWVPLTGTDPDYRPHKIAHEYIIWGFTKKAQSVLDLTEFVEVKDHLHQLAADLSASPSVKAELAHRRFYDKLDRNTTYQIAAVKAFHPLDIDDRVQLSADAAKLDELIVACYATDVPPADYSLQLQEMKKFLNRNKVLKLVAEDGNRLLHTDTLKKLVKP